MSSSSSSDSDDYEPMRKIQINIRPKEEVSQRAVADVNLIKASVEAWRPLGPPTHPSLARRQSSLSSVSSMSFGAGSIYGGSGNNNNTNLGPSGSIGSHPIHSSPSCSSLVSEFNARSSFSNFISTSRTSSPLMNQGDAVPIAIAIQESIELIIKGHYDPNATQPKYQTRSLGNIKVAFPNAFARSNYGNNNVPLRLRMHSTDNVMRYYASTLINDLDLGTNEESPSNFSSTKDLTPTSSSNGSDTAEHFSFGDAFDAETSQSSSNAKLIQFKMDSLCNQLRAMYDKCPNSRYYNVDILRYQICPINTISEAPLQVCAYWSIQAQLVKLRIDFKHSIESGFNLDRLREVTFKVKLSEFIPDGLIVHSMQNGSVPVSNLNNGNNNNNGATNFNFNAIDHHHTSGAHTEPNIAPLFESINDRKTETTNTLVRIPPPPLPQKSTLTPSSLRGNQRNLNTTKSSQIDPFQATLTGSSRYTNDLLLGFIDEPIRSNVQKNTETNSTIQDRKPYLSYKPQAQWDSKIKELTWKFDTLLSYHKNDGMGSLLAKLDFRDCKEVPSDFLSHCKPATVDVKFLVTDSTLSKVSLNVDSSGYKMSLLKKEIRSGRYKSEPYIL